MNTVMRQRLAGVAQDVQSREILTFFYRDHPQGASFEEAQLQQLVGQQILGFDGKRYTLTADARQVLDRDSTILLDELLRE